MSGVERALGLLRNLPRVSLSNLKPLPGSRYKVRKYISMHTSRYHILRIISIVVLWQLFILSHIIAHQSDVIVMQLTK